MFSTGRGACAGASPYRPAGSPYLRNLTASDDTPDGRESGRAELYGHAPAGTTFAAAGADPEGPGRGRAVYRPTSARADDRGSYVLDASLVGAVDEKGAIAAADPHPAPAVPHPLTSTTAVNVSMDGEVYGEEPRSPPGASVPTVGEDDDVASIVLKESCMKLYLAEEKAKELSKQLGDVEDLATSETERATELERELNDVKMQLQYYEAITNRKEPAVDEGIMAKVSSAPASPSVAGRVRFEPEVESTKVKSKYTDGMSDSKKVLVSYNPDREASTGGHDKPSTVPHGGYDTSSQKLKAGAATPSGARNRTPL